jgi:hypothetical protein
MKDVEKLLADAGAQRELVHAIRGALGFLPMDDALVIRAVVNKWLRIYATTPDVGTVAALDEQWEAGVRQAIAWLRADYEYGTGPQWREDGAEWIEDRLADRRRARHTGQEVGS